ncbi:hypothetical protein DPV78_000027 [Talaromyces pinophilus]|jgi:hypothetical protein|nr:hypothetical protein DPV78_000027 [Talaromyces pinophilus]
MAATTVKKKCYHASGKYIKEALLKQVLKNAFPDMTEESFDVKVSISFLPEYALTYITEFF